MQDPTQRKEQTLGSKRSRKDHSKDTMEPAQKKEKMAGGKRSRKRSNKETMEPAQKKEKMAGGKRSRKRSNMEPKAKKPCPEDGQEKRRVKKSRKRKHRSEESLAKKRKSAASVAEEFDGDQPRPGPSSVSSACPGDASYSIKRFKIRREIGRGSFGVVLLAYDRVTQKNVAMKLLEKIGMSGREVGSAEMERRALQATSGSPFLMHSLLTFQTEEHLGIIMEYASGGDLLQLQQKRGRLEMDAARFYAAEIVSGLQYFHMMGFIHRDIKPENILIDDAGHIKIADYGLAVTTFHGATGIAGTAGYIAPEMLSGQQYDAGVDWFSFGVVLFQLTTGKPRLFCKLSVLPDCHLSPIAEDILEQLLCTDPQIRLGVNGEICYHPFFAGMDWLALEDLRVQPPFIPGRPSMKGPPSPQMLEE